MNKVRITRFIQKYNLAGLVESVSWKTENGKLVTRFISDDKTVLGEVSLDNFTQTIPELGVYTTSQLIKLLSIPDEDIELDVQQIEGKAISLSIKNGDNKLQFQLADLAVIPAVPDLKSIPDWDIEIGFDAKFIDKFIKAKNALSDSDTFTIVSADEQLKIVLGYSNVNSTRVEFTAQKDFTKQIKPISFSAKYFKEILTANKEATSVTLKVSTDGLAHAEFKVDDFTSKYYLVEVQLTA